MLLFKRPKFVPQPYFDRVKRYRITVLLLAIVCLLAMIIVIWQVKFRFAQGVNIFGQMLLWTLYGCWPGIEFRRFKARLKQVDMRLCLGCGYILTGLPDDHRCPECGSPYKIEETRAAWDHWVRTRRLPEESRK